MSSGIFIAGTDTGVGKTIVTGLLARHLIETGVSTVTQKWIQTGPGDFPEDIQTHLDIIDRKTADISEIQSLVCPYHFQYPASPHLSAQKETTVIEEGPIIDAYHQLCARYDTVLVEGIGGCLVPYREPHLTIDIVKTLKLPVILVVGNKLGAINHTLLSIEALRSRNLTILGLIFNQPDPETTDPDILSNNKATIARLTGLPVIADLPPMTDPKRYYPRFSEGILC